MVHRPSRDNRLTSACGRTPLPRLIPNVRRTHRRADRRVGGGNQEAAGSVTIDAAVEKEASRWAEEIMSALALDQHVDVYVGPPDAVIHGTQYRQERLGTIEAATKRRRTGR